MTSFADGHAGHVTLPRPLAPNDPAVMGLSSKRPAASSNSSNSQAGICPTDSENIAPLQQSTTQTQDGNRRKIPKQSLEYVIRSGTAGGLAACAAKTVVAPLDRVKILFQASNPQFAKYTGSWTGVVRAMRDIYNANGALGLFRGHSATLLRIYPYGGIKFLAYEQIRAAVIPSPSHETHLRRFAAGSLAGIVSVFCTYPLEVVRVRLAWETRATKRAGVLDICRTIYHERPAPPSPAAAAAASTQQLKSAAESVLPRQAAAATTTASSALLHQTAAATSSSGLSNFYRGFTPTLWGMIPYAGASFLTHDAAGDFMRLPAFAPYTVMPQSEQLQKQLAPNKPQPLRAWAELTTGAVAGFVSQTVSYPLEVIRRRMQVGGVVGDGHRLTMMEVGADILRSRGWKGFFVGLGIGYVKVVPLAATSFLVYERMKVVFGI